VFVPYEHAARTVCRGKGAIDAFKGYEFQAQLAVGPDGDESNNAEAGRRTLAVLEREARSKGFVLVAAEAAKSAKE
jgi:hypothetical protein